MEVLITNEPAFSANNSGTRLLTLKTVEEFPFL
jgi:hypothetical protein